MTDTITAATYQNLPLERLQESASNPRRRYDEAALATLADSIRLQGVLQPILVRPIYDNTAPELRFEIVAGHRRVRAARLAELETIPAILRELTDREVRRVQLVENLQREDLDPVEEAQGYQALIDQHATTAREIAKEIGKSYEYVIARLKLLALGDECRDALAEGRISPSVAILLARLPKVIQGQALDRILTSYEVRQRGEAPSARNAAEIVRNQFTRPIKGAPFDTKVVYFHPHPDQAKPLAPKCADCDKRTSCAEDLFNADPKAPDMCMDGACYQAKTEAERREIIRKARESGATIIEGKAAEKLTQNGMHDLRGYVVDGRNTSEFGHWESVAKLVKAAGEHAPAPDILIDPEDGEPFKVYKTTALRTALEKAGYFAAGEDDTPKSGSAGSGSKAAKKPKEDPKARAARLAAERDYAVRMAIFRAVRGRMKEEIEVHGGLPWEEVVRAIAKNFVEDTLWNSDGTDELREAYGVKDNREIETMVTYGRDSHGDITGLPLPDLFLLMWSAVLCDHVDFRAQTRDADQLLRTADRLGVDVFEIEAQAVDAFNADNPETEEEKPAKAGKAKKSLKGATIGDLEEINAPFGALM